MDPLSIVANSLTLASIVLAGLSVLSEFRDSHIEATALVREISDVQVILASAESFIKEWYRPPHQQRRGEQAPLFDRLALVLKSVWMALQELEDLLFKKCVHRKPNGKISVKRWNWVSEDRRLGRHRASLQAAKLNLATMLGLVSANSACTTANENAIVVALRRELHASVRHIEQSNFTSFLRYQETLQNACGRVENARVQLDAQPNEEQSPLEMRSARLVATDMDATASLQIFSKEAYSTKGIGVAIEHGSRPIRYGLSVFPSCTSAAERKCQCCCHKRSSFSTPEVLRSIAGHFSATYVGMSGTCQRSCKRRSHPVAQLTIFLPHWLARRTISVLVSVPKPNAFSVYCHAPRVVPDDAKIFGLAKQGDHRGIQVLFDRGIASPYDICSSNGASALTYAIHFDHVDTWRFLLEAGADPYHENKSKQSSMDVAWGRIFSGVPSSDAVMALRESFDAAEYTETRRFPILHQIVLGMIDVSLESQLTIPKTMIDEADWQGRTALSWAAARADLASLKSLLNAGADPNIASFNRSTPLHFAVRSTEPSCIQPLLDAGGCVDSRNSWLATPLRYAALDRDDPAYLKPLLRAGADLKLKDLDGKTSMMVALDKHHGNTVACLLEHGDTMPSEGKEEEI